MSYIYINYINQFNGKYNIVIKYMENTEVKHVYYDITVIKENTKEKKDKKRVETENWNFNIEYYQHDKQMDIIKDISNNQYKYIDDMSKLVYQQIHKKISGYKQQDVIKKLYNKNEFITFNSIIDKMIECNLKCYYCYNEMNVLYDISREEKQWTVDRIDNDLGHNLSNYYLACLDCNLRRRRRSDKKFLFTKQLKIVKLPRENDNNSSLI